MKKLVRKIFTLSTLVLFLVSCNESLVQDGVEDAPGLKSANNGKVSYIVVLQDAELDMELAGTKGYEMRQLAVQRASARILNRAGILDGEVGHVYGTALKGFSVMIPPGQLKKLENDPSVKYVEEDKIVTLIKPKVNPGGGTVVEGEEVPWGIVRVGGGTAPYSGEGRAWIIDTGIDLDNPDLNVDESLGASFVRRVTSPDDDNGHGSHVSGTVAAKLDGNGVVGVAPGAILIPVKVLDKRGSGWTSGVVAGVDHVAAKAVLGDVANMSLGGGASTTLDNAVLAAAAVCKFALAAGNEGDDANYHSPARANGTNIYTVSAMDINDNWAYFSNYGNPPVDYCAPGVGVKSYNNVGSLVTWNGTSMATPHVTGILLWGNFTEDGKLYTDGTVNGDPDQNADPIAVVSGTTPPPPINNPPEAIAGANQIVNEGVLVTLNGSGNDLDNDPLTYQWTAPAGISLNNPKIPDPTFTAPEVDSETVYTFSLVVNDGKVNSSPDDVNITVKNVLVGGEIDLSAVITGNKVKKATLTWTGTISPTVDIYKAEKENNIEKIISITTVTNSGSYNENLGKITTGTFIYYIIDEFGKESNHFEVSVN